MRPQGPINYSKVKAALAADEQSLMPFSGRSHAMPTMQEKIERDAERGRDDARRLAKFPLWADALGEVANIDLGAFEEDGPRLIQKIKEITEAQEDELSKWVIDDWWPWGEAFVDELVQTGPEWWHEVNPQADRLPMVSGDADGETLTTER